ncbi:MAG TPA: helix-turn-helix domain-containing protein [Chloroflexi bacterium]|nr:helix-turn-helix domain-containing protein [Chloroflexota bacterium]
MARIFDVIEYASEMRDEIVRRFPENGPGDFRIGSQVIVRESQRAVFFRDGRALDVFGPGRHTITTANIPKLIDFVGKAFGNRTPFTAEVYFVSMREFADRKWGTPQPIVISTPGMGLGVALIQGFGTYSFQVSDPQQFVAQVVGAQGVYRTRDIEDRLRMMMLSKLQDLITSTKFNTIPELLSMTEELGAGIRAKAQDDFKALGLTLKTFYIGSLQPSEKSIEELRARGLLDLQTYTQLQAADAMRDAAQNPSGGAGLTAGIGAGMGIGNVLGQALSGVGQQPQRQAAAGGAAASGGMPAVMTPAEAAEVLRVSEEDVIAAIEAGDLKARKIGRAYRISKSALDEFLGS